MIDIENELFTKIATALRTEYSGIYVTGEYVAQPPKFPCVLFLEKDNVPYVKTQTNDMENHASIMYEVDVFSNKTNGKKSEAKSIAKSIDDVMLGLGFHRSFLSPIPNQNDATIYRIKARYTTIISKDKTIFRQ